MNYFSYIKKYFLALFLLDNHTKVWLWAGSEDAQSTNKDEFDRELKLAKQLIDDYIVEKTKDTNQEVKLEHIYAYKEPPEFKSLFPYWQ